MALAKLALCALLVVAALGGCASDAAAAAQPASAQAVSSDQPGATTRGAKASACATACLLARGGAAGVTPAPHRRVSGDAQRRDTTGCQ